MKILNQKLDDDTITDKEIIISLNLYSLSLPMNGEIL